MFLTYWLEIRSYLLEWLTELRKTPMLVTLLKGLIKDTDEHPNEEIYRARSWRVLGKEAGVYHLPRMRMH